MFMSFLERFNNYFDEVEYTDAISMPFLLERSGKTYEAIFTYRIKDNKITKFGKLGMIELKSGALHISNLIDHLSADDIVDIYATKVSNHLRNEDEAEYLQFYEKIVSDSRIQDQLQFDSLIERVLLSSDVGVIYEVLIRKK